MAWLGFRRKPRNPDRDARALAWAQEVRHNHGDGAEAEVARWLENPMLSPAERRRIEMVAYELPRVRRNRWWW